MKRNPLYRKKVPVAAALAVAAVCMFSGCAPERVPAVDDDRIQIVCTTYPQYDWTARLIRGNEENISLTLLMDKGGDLHNFQPSALDIAQVSACDLFIYVGGESDVWVDDALKEAVNPNQRVINMMEVVSEALVAEEHVAEGSGHEVQESRDQHKPREAQEQQESRAQQESHAHQEDHGYDEHVWLSLRNAETLVEYIAAQLAQIDSGNATLYRRNKDQYTAALRALDTQYAKAVYEGRFHTLLFADRFPFRYFVEDYGLDYYAAFDGCSAETEASFETVAYLSDKLEELELGSVIVLDGSDDRLARVIIESAGAKSRRILVLNSLQSVSRRDIGSGLSYLNAMEENLKVLRQALGQP